jgi:hypothetical protein
MPTAGDNPGRNVPFQGFADRLVGLGNPMPHILLRICFRQLHVMIEPYPRLSLFSNG